MCWALCHNLCVQTQLFAHVDTATVLAGHGLENDLRALHVSAALAPSPHVLDNII